jgi:hypothetical protein
LPEREPSSRLRLDLFDEVCPDGVVEELDDVDVVGLLELVVPVVPVVVPVPVVLLDVPEEGVAALVESVLVEV